MIADFCNFQWPQLFQTLLRYLQPKQWWRLSSFFTCTKVEEREKERERGSNLQRQRQRLASTTAQVLVAQTTQPVLKNRLRGEL